MSPYLQLMRWHRPLPILLLLWPVYWALWIAQQGVPDLKLLMIFTLGVVLTRSGGCVINDICDRKFDRFVPRTQLRPLAAGTVTVLQAILLAVIIYSIAAGLLLFLNVYTILLAFIALALTIIYPLSKRVFALPQLLLGITFNFGIIMVFAQVQRSISWAAILLYLAAISWSCAYDTMYALADLPYDKQLKLNSSALTFSKYVDKIIIALQITMLLLLFLLGIKEQFSWSYYALVSCSGIFFVHQWLLFRTQQAHKCLAAFNNNYWLGFLVFIAIIIQY